MNLHSKGFILIAVVIVSVGIAILLMDIERMVLLHQQIFQKLTISKTTN